MESVKVIVVPESEWLEMVKNQQEILKLLRSLQSPQHSNGIAVYITAMEFMQAVKIGRTKFDQLVAENKVKTIKKDRKIYVPFGEVERYFQTG